MLKMLFSFEHHHKLSIAGKIITNFLVEFILTIMSALVSHSSFGTGAQIFSHIENVLHTYVSHTYEILGRERFLEPSS